MESNLLNQTYIFFIISLFIIALSIFLHDFIKTKTKLVIFIFKFYIFSIIWIIICIIVWDFLLKTYENIFEEKEQNCCASFLED